MKQSPYCQNCGAFTDPVFNPETKRLKAWLCTQCEPDRHRHWFVPPTGTNWERELTPEQWAKCGNVVDINYRENKNAGHKGSNGSAKATH